MGFGFISRALETSVDKFFVNSLSPDVKPDSLLLSFLIHFSYPIFERYVLLTQYRAGDKIEKNEMGWACGAYG